MLVIDANQLKISGLLKKRLDPKLGNSVFNTCLSL